MDQRFEERFRARTRRSRIAFRRARSSVPDGVTSTARGTRVGWRPYPPSIAHGSGSRVVDLDGNVYVDLLMGLGPLLLGHRPPEVVEAVVRAIRERGTVFGLPHELEAEAAERVVRALPAVEMVRFTSSGSEAVATALRLARAWTNRPLVVRFEGHYHGWFDTANWSTHPDPARAGPAARPVPVPAAPGLPPELANSLVVCAWNDPESFTALMAEHGERVAAIIAEPIMLNTGCILPAPGWLELLRRVTRAHGSLLVFDEVKTGFWVSRGGAQELYGVLPDLTVLGKGLGGGFPAAALGGSREVMGMIAEGRFSQSGTYNANTIAVAAVCATLDQLRPQRYEVARTLARRLAEGLEASARDAGLTARAERAGSIVHLWFTDLPVGDWRSVARLVRDGPHRRWWQEMLVDGVLFHPRTYENLWVSLAHTSADIDRVLEAAAVALPRVAARGGADDALSHAHQGGHGGSRGGGRR
jgi:glutamate-1-semialdehyde 2,1-aminomutase